MKQKLNKVMFDIMTLVLVISIVNEIVG